MKTFLALLISLVSISCFAASTNSQQTISAIQMQAVNCGHAVPTSDPTFCASFKAIAYCHCHDEHGMPSAACKDMNRILQVMTATYGSLWKACENPRAQKDAPQQECFDDWTYYSAHCK